MQNIGNQNVYYLQTHNIPFNFALQFIRTITIEGLVHRGLQSCEKYATLLYNNTIRALKLEVCFWNVLLSPIYKYIQRLRGLEQERRM